MKKDLLLFVIILIVSSQLPGSVPVFGFSKGSGDTTELPNDSLKGDFDGDGKIETLYVTSNGCIDEEILESCICILSFSKKLPTIKIIESMGADLHNLGDLNGDGSEEFGYTRVWHGSWQQFHVLTYKNRKWVNLVPPFTVYLDYISNRGLIPIEKDKTKKSHVLVRSCEQVGQEVKIVTKSVKVR